MESGPTTSGRNSPGPAGRAFMLIAERIRRSGTLEERQPASPVRTPLALDQAHRRLGQVDPTLAADDESPVGRETAGAEAQQLRDRLRIVGVPDRKSTRL